MLKEKLLKKEIILPVLSIIFTLIALIGISYAIFMEEETTPESTIKFGDISMTFVSSSSKIGYDSLGNPVNMYPMTQEEAIATAPYTFTLTNTGTIDLWVTIYLEKDTSFVPSGNYTSYLNSDNTNVYYGIKETSETLTSGLYSNIASSGIIKTLTIEAGVTKTFNLWTWLKSDAPNTAQGTYFVADISARGEFRPVMPLAEAIKADNPEYVTQIVADDTMFESNATTDAGLWTENRAGKTESDLPVYFFRGAVQNNYVKFGSDASGDLIWRVIRINEDGSVRMILDKKLPDDNVFQLQSVDILKRNMYMPDNEVVSGSAANVLNTWYNTTFTTAQKAKVSTDAIYCNDMSTGRVDGDITYFGANTRLEASSPQFLCPQTNDKLVSTSSTLNASNVNKVLLQSVGLITADEIMYAGESWSTNNTSFYLNKSYVYWSLSPSNVSSVNGNANGFVVSPGNGLNGSDNNVWGADALVPVITLRSDILTTGTGVVGDEYIIQ